MQSDWFDIPCEKSGMEVQGRKKRVGRFLKKEGWEGGRTVKTFGGGLSRECEWWDLTENSKWEDEDGLEVLGGESC